jgi:hypothetical protein
MGIWGVVRGGWFDPATAGAIALHRRTGARVDANELTVRCATGLVARLRANPVDRRKARIWDDSDGNMRRRLIPLLLILAGWRLQHCSRTEVAAFWRAHWTSWVRFHWSARY